MAYKKLSEATLVETAADVANVLIEENDEIKRVPKSVMGKVKTVNGVEPDEAGNVAIETGGGVTYTDYFTEGSYLYSDENYQIKVTKEELATALETSIVRVGGPYAFTHFPYRVKLSDNDYGTVSIIELHNGEIVSVDYNTSEYVAGPQ